MPVASRNIKIVDPNARVRRRDLLAAENVLALALKKYGIDKDIARYKFVLHWKEIVGEEIANRTRPECIRKDALIVRVTNSSWAQELSFQKDVIVARLKKFLSGDATVNDVQFYVGDINR
jgi:predicted nucleic acid-binding Zn ribbon protein